MQVIHKYYSILYMGLEHPQILVSAVVGGMVLELKSYRYVGMTEMY